MIITDFPKIATLKSAGAVESEYEKDLHPGTDNEPVFAGDSRFVTGRFLIHIPGTELYIFFRGTFAGEF
jgi:hypothetical protein